MKIDKELKRVAGGLSVTGNDFNVKNNLIVNDSPNIIFNRDIKIDRKENNNTKVDIRRTSGLIGNTISDVADIVDLYR